ncbi:hypothetical protein PSN45_003197 [Yamadazyma tenuis]|uniref:uncharacterized protein n=1 Tax=Candida tenuis TaxID=2315449 RepID=UPI00279A8967|nr:hypothetical protein PSN45_003197 [Yamadazyma tenuis]
MAPTKEFDPPRDEELLPSVPLPELITYILPDFSAFKHFQRDFEQSNEFHLIEYTKTTGFDIYLVEQWVNNRSIGSLISTYTGNTNNEVRVVKLTVVKKPSKFYPIRFQEYLSELVTNHAKLKQMNLPPEDSENQESEVRNPSVGGSNEEYLFITNITSLPSHLSLIPILGGDIRVVEDEFVVNSNLKRLRCSGRSISLITPKISDANEDKFRRMYRIYNLNVPIKFAVRELINIIQTCLFYFDLLDARYCDGLLCNKTEEAIINWWNLIGLPHFNIRPNHSDGILPSRTVAAIISLTISIKIRLQIFGGCDVPKDPFDFENFMISIGEFQRQVKLEKKRKLDIETLGKLFYITSQKINPDREKHKIDYEAGDISIENISTNSFATGAIFPSTPQKKNKSYTKEIRKLTSAVKNTVQDRISTVNKPDDGIKTEASPNKTSGRLRERLAKLGESSNPSEVETLNLELLVNNHLVGRTLKRLWYGLSEHKTDASLLLDKDPSPHSNDSSTNTNKLYKFVSLRDSIANTQKIYYETSRYSRGLNRMKLGLQRNLLLPQQKKLYPNASALRRSHTQKFNPNLINSLSTVDALLKIPSDNSDDAKKPNFIIKEQPPKKCSAPNSQDIIVRFDKGLNRRNSFPFVQDSGETNLNLLELTYEGGAEICKKSTLVRRHSHSILQEYDSDLITLEKVSVNYLNDMKCLIESDIYKKSLQEENSGMNNSTLEKKYKNLDSDLQKLKSNNKQLCTSKAKLHNEDLPSVIEANMRNLSPNIDRLVYESRIIIKRINELEQNSKILKAKSKDQSYTKINNIVNDLIYSHRFHRVFKNQEERTEILLKLTGGNEEMVQMVEREINHEEESAGFFRIFVMFLWEMIILIFQLFKFDRSKMNLDRIRQTWVKLDPNRKYINRAYEFVGYEPTGSSESGSRSSRRGSTFSSSGTVNED